MKFDNITNNILGNPINDLYGSEEKSNKTPIHIGIFFAVFFSALLVYRPIGIYGNSAEVFYSSAEENLGYREASLFRASSAVKCQVTLHASSLRMFSQAETSCLTVSRSINLRARHWRVMALSSISAIFSQLPCFGV